MKCPCTQRPIPCPNDIPEGASFCGVCSVHQPVQHVHFAGDAFMDAIKESFVSWLDSNRDDLIRRLAALTNKGNAPTG